MPLGKSGKYYMDPMRAMRDNEASSEVGSEPPKSGEAAMSTTLHDHGDGTFHTECGGKQEEHPDLDAALESMRARHAGTAIQGSQMHS